jgi:hypothetical protein
MARQLVIHLFWFVWQDSDEAESCSLRNLHLFWLVWQGSDEAKSLWQQVIHLF